MEARGGMKKRQHERVRKGKRREGSRIDSSMLPQCNCCLSLTLRSGGGGGGRDERAEE